MALKKLEADLAVISKLGTNPGVDDGLSEEQIKAKFDEAVNIIKDYLNNYLIAELDKTVDVNVLLTDLLDITLSKKDKAANAAATGDAIRALRTFFEKTVHSGDYVLQSGGSFAASNPTYSNIRIEDGVGVIQGNLFALPAQEVVLEEGTAGLRRTDLVIVRCTKNADKSLSYQLMGLTGNLTSGEPVTPEYQQSDINADGTVRDFPLYLVEFNGLNIVAMAPMFTAEKPIADRFTHTEELRAVLIASGWTGDAAPYTQTVQVEGITVDDSPDYWPVYSGTNDEMIAQKEAYAVIDRLTTADGSITVICFEEKPEVDITIGMEVHR